MTAAPDPPTGSPRRVRLRVTGIVQGVGFRPYVHRLARSLALGGFVGNDTQGVFVEAEGAAPAIVEFLTRLPRDAPALALVERVAVEELPVRGDTRFHIAESDSADDVATLIAPDTATCAECLAELFEPSDRRHRYPFINCTNCGPRFTIIRALPYDRPTTTMAAFRMCAACRAEYEDPADRRFHAQPNACPACGPTARLLDASGSPAPLDGSRDAIEATAWAIMAGAIAAVKGVGGYHLACRADHADAVQRLRSLKHREEKPFAVMAPDLVSARLLVELDSTEERLLTGRARPILLARRLANARVATAVAPRQRCLGVMLPYSPLHHILLHDAGVPLVMTSGNRSDEPIAYRDDDALERLSGIADIFLVHDRPIETRTDDSVLRVVTLGDHRAVLTIRRSRGYVPMPIELPTPAAHAVLACGGQLKNTFCLARADRAFVGPHIGDVEDVEALRSYRDGIGHLASVLAMTPELVAHDLHPEYISTKYALERDARALVGVQHHHAHLAACLAEHGERGPAIGVIFDGTGYGTDGTIWGGELLLGDLTDFERVGHLYPVPMPGGEAAIREPWRMACSWLAAAAIEQSPEAPPLPRLLAGSVDERKWSDVARLTRTRLASPSTTSVGRLLDAISALCGLCVRTSYEGQAAIELEMAADTRSEEHYGLPVRDGQWPLVLDARPLVSAAARDISASRPVSEVAACTHNGISRAAVLACVTIAARSGTTTVVLSGGVFQNAILLERTAAALAREGLRVLVPERLPPNDGGLSFGQAAIAASRWSSAKVEDAGDRTRMREGTAPLF